LPAAVGGTVLGFSGAGRWVGGFEVHGVSGLALTVTLQAGTTAAQISA